MEEHPPGVEPTGSKGVPSDATPGLAQQRSKRKAAPRTDEQPLLDLSLSAEKPVHVDKQGKREMYHQQEYAGQHDIDQGAGGMWMGSGQYTRAPGPRFGGYGGMPSAAPQHQVHHGHLSHHMGHHPGLLAGNHPAHHPGHHGVPHGHGGYYGRHADPYVMSAPFHEADYRMGGPQHAEGGRISNAGFKIKQEPSHAQQHRADELERQSWLNRMQLLERQVLQQKEQLHHEQQQLQQQQQQVLQQQQQQRQQQQQQASRRDAVPVAGETQELALVERMAVPDLVKNHLKGSAAMQTMALAAQFPPGGASGVWCLTPNYAGICATCKDKIKAAGPVFLLPVVLNIPAAARKSNEPEAQLRMLAACSPSCAVEYNMASQSDLNRRKTAVPSFPHLGSGEGVTPVAISTLLSHILMFESGLSELFVTRVSEWVMDEHLVVPTALLKVLRKGDEDYE